MLDTNILKGFDIFSDISSDKLALIAKNCDSLEFKPNDVIFNQDEVAMNFYGVIDGEVELYIVHEDEIVTKEIQYEESIQTQHETVKKTIVIDSVGPGEVFGWSSFVVGGRLTATARCTTHSRLFNILADDLNTIFDKDTALGYIFMRKINEVIWHHFRKRTDKLIEAWVEAFDVKTII